MKTTMLIACVAVSMLAWTGQVEGQCCFAKKYEVRAAGTFTSNMDPKPEDIFMPRMSVDFDKKMLSIDAELMGKFPRNSTMIFDYGKQTGYFISFKPQSCFMMPIPGTMDGPCVPKDAKHLGDIKVGYGKQALGCESWTWKKRSEKPRSEEEISMLIQKDGCIPITETQKLKSPIFSMTQTVLYFDYIPKIRDAAVFDIPSFCKYMSTSKIDTSDLSHLVSSILRKFTK